MFPLQAHNAHCGKIGNEDSRVISAIIDPEKHKILLISREK
jgi:hypothetical protein